MAELMLGQPLFPGESGIDQLVEIIKVLGTPTRDQIKTMNPSAFNLHLSVDLGKQLIRFFFKRLHGT